jgi:hypothetical protein
MTHGRQTWRRWTVAALLGLGGLLGAGLGGCGSDDESDAGVLCDSEGPPAHVGGTWILSGTGKRTGCSDDNLNRDFELLPTTFEVVEVDPNQYDGGVQQDVAPQADAPGEAGADAGDAGGAEAGADAGDAGGAEAGADAGDAGGAEAGTDAGTDSGTPTDGGGGDGAAPEDGGTTDAVGDGPIDAAGDALQQDAAQRDAAPPIVYQPALLRLESAITGFDLQGEVRGECVTFDTSEQTDLGNVTYSFRGTYESFGRRVEGTFTGKGPGSSCRTTGTFTVEIQ